MLFWGQLVIATECQINKQISVILNSTKQNVSNSFWCRCISGIILAMGSANESRSYYVTPPLIGRAHDQVDLRCLPGSLNLPNAVSIHTYLRSIFACLALCDSRLYAVSMQTSRMPTQTCLSYRLISPWLLYIIVYLSRWRSQAFLLTVWMAKMVVYFLPPISVCQSAIHWAEMDITVTS